MNHLYYLYYLSTAVLLIACGEKVDNGDRYGESLSLKEETAISAILDAPADYVGKEVRISGTVLEVCPMKGCWIDVATPAQDEQKIRVKVEDDVIVFPQSAKGGFVIVEGQVEELRLSKEQVLAEEKHHAEEMGRDFDPTQATTEKTIYRIKGKGALIRSE